MPGQFQVTSFFDTASIKAEVDQLIKLNQDLAATIKSVFSDDTSKKMVDTFKSLREESTQTTKAINDLATAVKSVEGQEDKLVSTIAKYNHSIEEQTKATLAATAATQQLIAQLNATGVAATNSANAVNKAGGSVMSSLKSQKLVFMDFMRVLTGSGFSLRNFTANFALVGPAVAIAGAAVYEFVKYLNKQTDAQKLAAAHMKILRGEQDALYDSFKNQNAATQTALKNNSEEFTKVTLLTTALKQGNLTRKETIEAVNELKKIAPDQFSNLDAEHLKVDQLTKDWNNYNNQLLRHIETQLKIAELTNQVQKRLTFENDFKAAADQFDKMISSGKTLEDILATSSKTIKEQLGGQARAGLAGPNAKRPALGGDYFDASALQQLAKFRMAERDILNSIGKVSAKDLGLNDIVGKNNTDYEAGFKQLEEQFQKFHEKAFGLDLDPFKKELNDLYIVYEDGWVKINDTRDKDNKKVQEDLNVGLITEKRAADERLKIAADTNKARVDLQAAYDANVLAAQNKQAKKLEDAARTKFLKDVKNQEALQKKTEEDDIKKSAAEFKNTVEADKKNLRAHPSYKNAVKLAQDERNQTVNGLNNNKNLSPDEISNGTAAADAKLAEDKREARNKEIDKYVAYSSKAIDTVTSLEKAAEERKLNAIQRQIDLNNLAYESETRNIANSTLSLQDKAARQIILDAQVHAQNEALQRKMRDEKIKEAKFDKEATIMRIILSTAAAVMKAAPVIPLMLLAGITGAAELAVAAAQPIPHYADGTNFAGGGLSKVSERGSELVEDPSGRMWITPPTESYVNLQRGSKVTPHERLKQMMLDATLRSTMVRPNNNSDKKLDELKAITESGDKEIVKAIKNIKGPTILLEDMSEFKARIQQQVFK